MSKRIKEDCYTKVLKTVKKYKLIETKDKIVIGVSGGPDSMCLLDVLLKIQKQNCQRGHTILATEKECQNGMTFFSNIVVAHVNHMIREEANQDEDYVRNYCQKNNIEFYSKSIDVQKIAYNNKIGLEEAGRKERYKFFNEIMEKTSSNKIAIAHNQNDNAETVIMHLLRGSGTAGLKGIEPKRNQYIRPLIECNRKEIEEYCAKQGLNPRIDKTNFENNYTRNKIRNIVIPYIEKEFNPNIIKTLNRLSQIMCEEQEYIQKQVEKAYNEIVLEENKNEVVLDLKKFNMQEKVIKSNIIIYTITRLFEIANGIEAIHIEDIIKLCENNIGNKYLTPNKNLKIFVKNGKIKISKEN